MALAYIDWARQEFGIGGCLSNDAAMVEAYVASDPYLAFAIQAGAAPPDATKASHEGIRNVFKMVVLGVGYGMSKYGLAARLGISVARAADVTMVFSDNAGEFDIEAAGLEWERTLAPNRKSASAASPYLRGPIPWSWLRGATELGSGTLATGLAVWHLRTLNKQLTFRASLYQLSKWTGLSERVTREGLHRLESAGLVEVERPSGRSPTITLVETPSE